MKELGQINFCLCGCGTPAANKFASGHNRRNAKHSKESREKMRRSHIGVPLSEKHKRSLSAVLIGIKHNISVQGRQNIEKAALRRRGIPHTAEHRRKISVAVTGEKNPFYGRHHTIETKKFLSEENKSRELLLSDEEKRRRNSNLFPATKGEYSHTKATCRRLSEILKKRWQNPDYVKKQMKARGVTPNKTEFILQCMLDRMFPNEWKYVGDGQVIISGKCPDFINVNGQKKIIELFGDFWHKPEEVDYRKAVFKPFGYETLIIWERELKKEPDSVIEKIKNFATVG